MIAFGNRFFVETGRLGVGVELALEVGQSAGAPDWAFDAGLVLRFGDR